MADRTKSVCFTGHREIKLEHQPLMNRVLLHAIKVLYHRGYRVFLTGGALGFDTAAAQAVIEARKHLEDIQLCLILPCKDQTRKWKESDKAIYEAILGQADKVQYISEAYTQGCMFTRNRALVDNSSYCIAYQYKSGGGTSYTVNYAQSKGITIYNTFNRLEELLRKGTAK